MQNSTTRLAIGAMIALGMAIISVSAVLLRPNKGFSSTGTNPSCRRPMRRGSMIVSSSEDTYLRIGAVMRPISDHDRSVGVVSPVPAVMQRHKLCGSPAPAGAERSSDVADCMCARVSLSLSAPLKRDILATLEKESSEEWPPVRKHETGRGHLRPLPS